MSDSVTNNNYVGNTKVSVMIKKNLCQQMHIKRDISIWNLKIMLKVFKRIPGIRGRSKQVLTICLLSA